MKRRELLGLSISGILAALFGRHAKSAPDATAAPTLPESPVITSGYAQNADNSDYSGVWVTSTTSAAATTHAYTAYYTIDGRHWMERNQ